MTSPVPPGLSTKPEAQTINPHQRGRIAALIDWWGPRPITQIAIVTVVIAALFWFCANVLTAMARSGIHPGLGFLSQPAGFQIGESPIPFQAGDSYFRAIVAGLLNTAKVALSGCVLATCLGVIVGVTGLAHSRILAWTIRSYIEIIRNTPLLLQLFFWIALMRNLPGPRQALGGGGFYLSNRGAFLPAPEIAAAIPAIAGCGAVICLTVWAARQRRSIGKSTALFWGIACGAVAAILWLSGLQFSIPKPQGFNIRGGLSLTPEFAALLIGLTVKFSATIAEIVRAGILSVSLGQREAARALGLSEARIMRLVVLPQALRVIVPLTTSCFLDLIKDSSLAVAIGYPDLVSILNTTANTTGQAVETLAVMAATFLTINLGVSALMGVYNRKVALRGESRQ